MQSRPPFSAHSPLYGPRQSGALSPLAAAPGISTASTMVAGASMSSYSPLPIAASASHLNVANALSASEPGGSNYQTMLSSSSTSNGNSGGNSNSSSNGASTQPQFQQYSAGPLSPPPSSPSAEAAPSSFNQAIAAAANRNRAQAISRVDSTAYIPLHMQNRDQKLYDPVYLN